MIDVEQVEQGQELSAVWATDAEWRFIAACILTQLPNADEEDERKLAALWTRIHPEGDV